MHLSNDVMGARQQGHTRLRLSQVFKHLRQYTCPQGVVVGRFCASSTEVKQIGQSNLLDSL